MPQVNYETDMDLDGAPVMANQYGPQGGFLPFIFGSWIAEAWHVIKGTDHQLYRWLRGAYVLAQESIEAAVVANHGAGYKRGRAEDIVNWLMKLPATDVSKPVEDGYLNVLNGVLDWRTGELLDHGPEWLTTSQLPIRWNPDAGRGEGFVDRFMKQAVAEDSVDLVWEMIGYCLSGTNKYQKAFLLYGPGGNGKSKLLAFVNGLLGMENMTANSFSSLSSNRFRCAQLTGKLANVCGDISDEMVESTEIFKQLVGGDPIEVEKKGQDPYTLNNRAVLVFSANGFPKVRDHSQGFFERFLFISMPVKFRGTDREVVGLERWLCAPEELERGLVRAVAGLRRLEERGRFPVVESSAQLAGEYRESVDSVVAFVNEMVEWTGEMLQSTLYIQYEGWCARNGIQPKSSRRFWSEFRSNYGGGGGSMEGEGGLYSLRKRDGYPWLVGVSVRWGVSVV